jgi:AcrR family transcriptional regulator
VSRATSLPTDERRAAIAEATLPLLLEHGASVTTRQIAEAAGIAEGTIFRVYPDKESVIVAAVQLAFDTAPVRDAVATIDLDLPLEDRLREAVEIIQERTTRIFSLMSVLASITSQRPALPQKKPGELDGLAALFEPDADRLRCDPHRAAQVLRAVTFGGTHPMFIVDVPLKPDEIVDLALGGLLADHPDPTIPR